ncbi:recQ-mediated genome instability protein 2 [Sceloporus undulatus]|uniref:recQ-mediated genome instability protein 2 n=1 Tax=Sceloporus undulatus TaxID=8520 RepID=UPI001C4BFE81|nr:recQ-mediated genome instability protein 2 [Sceloporus undulatus]
MVKPGEGRPWQAPPVKLLASQLRGCRRRCPGGAWLLGREERGLPPLAVPLVWMQGTVEAVAEEEEGGGRLRLRDGSGGAFVAEGARAVPQGRPCLCPGKYVMVLGLVQDVGPEPTLRALKVTDLSGNPWNQSMWEMEVEDLHRNLCF